MNISVNIQRSLDIKLLIIRIYCIWSSKSIIPFYAFYPIFMLFLLIGLQFLSSSS